MFKYYNFYMDLNGIKIVKSRRKSLCIEIVDNQEIILRAPLKAKERDIINFILKHKDWIEKKLKILKDREEKFKPKNFVDGEKFLFLGNYYDLKLVEKQKLSLIFNDRFYLKKSKRDKAREIFKKFYKNKAKDIISERVKFYAEKFGFKYNKIKITSANKRWGSCSNRNNLNFSYKLVMAPLEIIDYIVVHELVHTINKTHNKSFYSEISKILPQYKSKENWLKENGFLLKI